MQGHGERNDSDVYIPMHSEQRVEYGPNDINTAIIEASGDTRFPVLDGFWMQGDLLAFLTFDVEHNNIYVEVVQFAGQELRPRLLRRLCTRGSFDSWDCAIDEQRKYISFFFYEWVSPVFLTFEESWRKLNQPGQRLFREHLLSDLPQ